MDTLCSAPSFSVLAPVSSKDAQGSQEMTLRIWEKDKGAWQEACDTAFRRTTQPQVELVFKDSKASVTERVATGKDGSKDLPPVAVARGLKGVLTWKQQPPSSHMWIIIVAAVVVLLLIIIILRR
jgi:hypothetical protein